MSLPRSINSALVACAIVASASPLAAQLANAPVLPLGRTQDGTLARTDPTLNEKGRFQIFRLDVKAGVRYSIVMRADDFDSYLSVARQVNGLTDYLISDDDGAGNSNARLKWTPKVAGTYYLVAQSLKDDGVGNFTVRLDTMPAVIITPPRMVAMGEPMTGELAETDPMVDDKGSFYDLYKITARKGQRLTIEMKAGDLDSFVGIGRMTGDSLTIDETDDDGGGEKNSAPALHGEGRRRVHHPRPGAGSQHHRQLHTQGHRARHTAGRDHEHRGQHPGHRSSSPRPTKRRMTAPSSTCTASRCGPARKSRSRMRSSAFDSYLVLGQMVDGDWSQTAHDDDGAGGNNARLSTPSTPPVIPDPRQHRRRRQDRHVHDPRRSHGCRSGHHAVGTRSQPPTRSRTRRSRPSCSRPNRRAAALSRAQPRDTSTANRTSTSGWRSVRPGGLEHDAGAVLRRVTVTSSPHSRRRTTRLALIRSPPCPRLHDVRCDRHRLRASRAAGPPRSCARRG